MSAANGTIALQSKMGGAVSCTSIAHAATVNKAVISFVKGLVQCKTWAFLSEKLGICERTAKHRLAGTREFTAAELAILLRQERGRELLVAIMGDAEPKWWTDFLRQMSINDARKKAARLQRELEETIHAVDETAAAIARAEHAAAVSDAEFYRPHVSALRSVARVQSGPVAPAGKARAR